MAEKIKGFRIMAKLEKIIKFGFYLFIFLLPWQTRLIHEDIYLNDYVWEYGRLSLYGTEILLWLILFLYGFWLFKLRHLKKIEFTDFLNRLKKPAVQIYWLLVLFMLIAGLSILWSLSAQLAYYRWFVLVEAMAMLSMLLVFNFKLAKIAIVWVATAAIQSVFAIWQFFAQYVMANKWLGLAEHLPNVGGSIILQTQSERWLRAYGGLPHPNMLAGFLVIAILFLLYLAFIAQKRNQRVFVLTSLLVITPALFFTFSRSAWIALILSLGLLAFWLYRHKHYLWGNTFFKVVLLLILIAIILSFNLREPVMTRIMGGQDLEVASIKLRFAFTKQAWQLIQDRPILGQGIGNYTLGVFQKINASWPGYYYQPVHNIYLLILAELGIFGLLIWGIALILLLWNLTKTASSLEKVIAFLALFSLLIISLFDHYFWSLYFGVIVFWLILGLNLKQLSTNK
jgi:hypothetical protein